MLPSSRRLRFSLAGLLLIVTTASVAAAIWGATRRYAVTAYLLVRLNQPSIGAAQRLSPMDIERTSMEVLALLESPAVIEAALGKAGIQVQGDASASRFWIDRIQVQYPGNGELLQLRIDSRGRDRSRDVKVLEAVIDAFIAANEARNRRNPEIAAEVTIVQEPVAWP
jgi:hypothetical protein